MSSRWRRRTFRFAALVLSAFFCADIAMAILGASLTKEPPNAGASAAVPAGQQQKKLRQNVQFYLSPLSEKNLFGEAPPEGAKPDPVGSENVPESALSDKLTLIGTAVSDAPGGSAAVIENKSARLQDVYHLRDTVLEEATIDGIEPSCVVLLRGGQREKLCLEVGKTQDRKRRTASAAARTASAASSGLYTPSPDSIQKVDDSTYRVDSEEVSKAMENLSTLFTQVRAVPNFRDGKTDGFRLFSIKKDSIFDQMGLRNGDVVRKVNDYEVNSPEVALQLFQDLRNARDVNLEVMRNDRVQSLAYQVR